MAWPSLTNILTNGDHILMPGLISHGQSRPFSDRTAAEFLPMLSDPTCWDTLVSRLRHVFWLDDDFSEKVFRRQMSVVRGQLFNLREALRYRESPSTIISNDLG